MGIGIHIKEGKNKKFKINEKQKKSNKAYEDGYERIFGKQTIEERIDIAKKNAGRQTNRKKVVITQSDSKNFESESAGVGLGQVNEYQQFSDEHGINVKFDKRTGNPTFRTRNDKLKYLKEVGKRIGKNYHDKNEVRG